MTLGEMYPQGTPLDDHGMPLADADIPEDVARGIPLDPESARTLQQTKQVFKRKSNGELNVKWNPDNRTKFIQAKQYHPNSYVGFSQVSPVEDHNIDPRQVSVFQDYSDIVRYIRENHWKGEQATYQFKIYDLGQPQWATGRIEFGADPEWVMKKNGVAHQEEDMARRGDPYYPHGYPPPGYPPPQYGGYPPPQYGGYPPPYQAAPPPPPQQQQAPQAPPPPPPAPMPVQVQIPPSSTESEVVRHLLGQVERLSSMYASLYEQVRYEQSHPPPQQPPGMPGYPPPGYPPPGYPQPPQGYTAELAMKQQQQQPERPKSMLEQMKEAAETMQEVTRIAKSISEDNAPPPEPEKPPEKPDDFPFKVRELPHMRFVTTQDGAPVDMATTLMLNGDKIKDFFEGIIKEAKGFVTQRDENAEQERQRALTAMREAVELKRQMLAAPPSTPSPQQRVSFPAQPQRPFPMPAQPAPQRPFPTPAPPPEPIVQPPPPPAATAARAFGAVGKPKILLDVPMPVFRQQFPDPPEPEPVEEPPKEPLEPEVVAESS